MHMGIYFDSDVKCADLFLERSFNINLVFWHSPAALTLSQTHILDLKNALSRAFFHLIFKKKCWEKINNVANQGCAGKLSLIALFNKHDASMSLSKKHQITKVLIHDPSLHRSKLVMKMYLHTITGSTIPGQFPQVDWQCNEMDGWLSYCYYKQGHLFLPSYSICIAPIIYN